MSEQEVVNEELPGKPSEAKKPFKKIELAAIDQHADLMEDRLVRFCNSPSKLQLSMDKESFKRSPELKEHFPDEIFFSSVPACMFYGASLSLLILITVVISFAV